MATQRMQLKPEEAQYLSSAFPQYIKTLGTNFPVPGLAFDAAAEEKAYWSFVAQNYGSGNLTLILHWNADTATANNCMWGCRMAAITAGTDAQSVRTKAFGSQQTQITAASGTANAEVVTTITISNLDSLANGDEIWLEISRVGNHASDTMTGDAILTMAELSWSDS